MDDNTQNVAQLAEKYELGEPINLYGTNPTPGFIVCFALLLLLGGIFAWLVPNTSPSFHFSSNPDFVYSNLDFLLLTGIALVWLLIALVGLPVVFLSRHVTVSLYTDGLVYKQRRGVQVVRWEQIAEVEHPRREEKRVTHLTQPYLNTLPGYYEEKREYVTKETGSCALRLKDGERVEFDSMIGDHFGLSWAIEHQRTQFRGTPPRAHRKQKKATKANDAIREGQSIEPLLVALRDVDSGVRVQAVQDLGTLGGAQAIDPLLTALHDPASAVREAAASAFIGIGDGREIEPLLAALQDPDSLVRYNAAIALGVTKDRRVIEPLAAALRDPESSVRVAAAGGLGYLGDKRAVEPLLAALQDPEWDVRESAAMYLSDIKDARVVEPLLAALQDPVSTVRRQVAETLGSIGEQQAVESLVVALGDPDSTVREAAREALSRLQSTG
jgi:hypothetical protein